VRLRLGFEPGGFRLLREDRPQQHHGVATKLPWDGHAVCASLDVRCTGLGHVLPPGYERRPLSPSADCRRVHASGRNGVRRIIRRLLRRVHQHRVYDEHDDLDDVDDRTPVRRRSPAGMRWIVSERLRVPSRSNHPGWRLFAVLCLCGAVQRVRPV